MKPHGAMIAPGAPRTSSACFRNIIQCFSFAGKSAVHTHRSVGKRRSNSMPLVAVSLKFIFISRPSNF